MKNNGQKAFFRLVIVGGVAFIAGLVFCMAWYHFHSDKTPVHVASAPENIQPDDQNERLDPLSEQNAGNQELHDTIEGETDLISVLKNDTTEAAIRKSILSPPATEEQIKKALSFMPDVVAEVNDIHPTL